MSNIHSISTFITAFNGGTRPNRFRITGTKPQGVVSGGNQLFIDTHCVATTLPESTVGIIPIPFRGRIYKFPGDRTYSEWTATILDDTGTNDTWKMFHQWSELFNNHVTNTAGNVIQRPNYCQDLTIQHLSHEAGAGTPGSPQQGPPAPGGSTPLKSIQLREAWPVQVGPVQLDMSAANQLTQFQVQIAYSHFVIT